MAKRATRPNKPTQQKTKEEQWRRRATQHTQSGVGTVAPRAGSEYVEATTDGAATGMAGAYSSPAQGRPAPASGARPQPASSSLGGQRRTAVARTASARGRVGVANALSLDEEMRYVRGDIRRLILLTAACLAVLILLAFILPR